MNVLILCNVLLPEISKKISKPVSLGGGWLSGTIDGLLSRKPAMRLCVCCPVFDYNGPKSGKTLDYSFYLFNRNVNQVENFKSIIEDVKPDIIHIFGTEYKHSFDMLCAADELGLIDNCIVSIQGLVSKHISHYFASLPSKAVNHWTFKELIKRKNIYSDYEDMKKRSVIEVKTLRKARNIIGRTNWDKASVSQINSNVRYFKCNETLRNVFYEKQNSWCVENCERNSIFVSQAGYPIKGFHWILECLPYLVEKYPDVKVYTTGTDPRSVKWYQKNSYQVYLELTMKRLGIEDHVQFLGGLNDVEMCNVFLKANVFVSASSIENSSNSIGEAMLLGVPVVASYVGGTMDIIEDQKEAFLYQADAPYMLAYYIDRVFSDSELVSKFRRASYLRAKNTHNRDANSKRLIEIYDCILERI